MNDLKIVFYIVIAIIWVVYNNYRKIGEASRKRDFSKPPGDIIQENWPSIPSKPVIRETMSRKEIVLKQQKRDVREAMERKPLVRKGTLRKPTPEPLQSAGVVTFNGIEGGYSIPSKVAQFEESVVISEEPHPMINWLRNMDLRQAIVMSEVLKRPYN
jgi:hypothetical protein